MNTRIVTGFLLGVVLIPIFYFGGWVLDVALILFSLIATWELSRMFAQELRHPKIVLVFQMLFSGGIFFSIRSYYQGLIDLDWVFLLIIFKEWEQLAIIIMQIPLPASFVVPRF